VAQIRLGWIEVLRHSLNLLIGKAGEGRREEQAAEQTKEGPQQQEKAGFDGGSLYQPVCMGGTRSATAILVCRNTLN